MQIRLLAASLALLFFVESRHHIVDELRRDTTSMLRNVPCIFVVFDFASELIKECVKLGCPKALCFCMFM